MYFLVLVWRFPLIFVRVELGFGLVVSIPSTVNSPTEDLAERDARHRAGYWMLLDFIYIYIINNKTNGLDPRPPHPLGVVLPPPGRRREAARAWKTKK